MHPRKIRNHTNAKGVLIHLTLCERRKSFTIVQLFLKNDEEERLNHYAVGKMENESTVVSASNCRIDSSPTATLFLYNIRTHDMACVSE